jgi:hypothetical protein
MKIRLFLCVLAFAVPEPAGNEITFAISIEGGRMLREMEWILSTADSFRGLIRLPAPKGNAKQTSSRLW